ncbi:MAG: HAMP domain-containing protein, partial [Ignavibacteriae bacterium]|nr:HAMP domain-containing protein [Ignavibacteriota bacterium]
MSAALRDIVFERLVKRRSRRIGIVFFIVGLLVLSHLAEYLVVSYYDRNWEKVVDAECEDDLRNVEERFSGLQRTTRRITAELAQHSVIVEHLARRNREPASLFSHLSTVSERYDVGVEVYDKEGALVAWEGRSGPPHQREVQISLGGQLTSYVTRGSIYSQLFVAVPVRAEGNIVGAIITRRTIEVNYPLNNKYITREGLVDQLSKDLGTTVEIAFGENAEMRKDGRFVSVSLLGIDGRKVGVASVMRPARSTILEQISNSFALFHRSLVVLLLAIVLVLLSKPTQRIESLFLRSMCLTGLVWLARYSLLWIDVPTSFVSTGIFDPTHFASKFGAGLAKSIGEMTLTSLALLLNTVLVAQMMLRQDTTKSPWWYPWHGLVRLLIAMCVTTLIYLLLRGYGAIIRSVVFDSTLKYNDPRVIVPSFELGLMVFNLFVISFCLIVVVVGLTSFLVTLSSGKGLAKKWKHLPWISVAALFIVAAILFGELQENPLMSASYRLAFGFGMLVFTYYIHRAAQKGQSLSTLGNSLLALALSAVFFYPLLDDKVHERDRERVEVFAGEVLRPVDSWLKNVVDEALRSFESEETLDILLGAEQEETSRLAFTHWARSSASREGYNCLFAVFDETGKELSRFVIGGQSLSSLQISRSTVAETTRSIRVEEVGSGINAVKIYTGMTPIEVAGRVVGYGLVVVSAGQQALFRGETPTILRTSAQENLESFYRPVIVSEFRNAALFTTNDKRIPVGYKMSPSVREQFVDARVVSLWAVEHVGDREYETFYVRRSPGSDAIVALGLEQLGMLWHLFGIVKVMVYYAVVVIVVLIGFFAVQWARGKRYDFAFRGKLLVALFVTAIVPIVIIALYGRLSARERLMENLAQRLEQETSTVGLNLLQRFGDTLHAAITPLMAEQLAVEAGTDFNLYFGRELRVSSRPELYEAGILDRRLSGAAFANVIMKGKRFHIETENIGLYQYAVGYRPLLDEEQNTIGIISVPTLYRQDTLDEEISKSNAILFGVYAIVFIAIMIIATTFANRIASPIHRLTEATKRVSQGDLNVRVKAAADGEIGELIRSFEKMTKDLQRSREDLVRFEREVAWKEMAKQVAHEIKNPLTPMKLSLQHLRQTYK